MSTLTKPTYDNDSDDDDENDNLPILIELTWVVDHNLSDDEIIMFSFDEEVTSASLRPLLNGHASDNAPISSRYLTIEELIFGNAMIQMVHLH